MGHDLQDAKNEAPDPGEGRIFFPGPWRECLHPDFRPVKLTVNFHPPELYENTSILFYH